MTDRSTTLQQYVLSIAQAISNVGLTTEQVEVVKDSSESSQSLPVCVAFAAASGFLRVCATMVLAYPEYLEKKRRRPRPQRQTDPEITTINDEDDNSGINSSSCSGSRIVFIAAHLLILMVAAILSIVSTIYGPVSISVPVQTGCCLLFNVAAMGIVLKMRAFDKAQRTGTCKLVLSMLRTSY